jgi:NADH-quinone oxidoreductase subunit C
MSQVLKSKLASTLSDVLLECELVEGEVTVYVAAEDILSVSQTLRDDFGFEQLMDLCGVDYSTYGGSAWLTKAATDKGFSRAVDAATVLDIVDEGYRYAVVYHLMSLQHNQRLRVKVRLDAESPIVDSVTSIWESAGWFEREAFDLFGFCLMAMKIYVGF